LGRDQGVTKRLYADTLKDARSLAASIPGSHPVDIFNPDSRKVIVVRNPLGLTEALAAGAAAGAAQAVTQRAMRNPYNPYRAGGVLHRGRDKSIMGNRRLTLVRREVYRIA
jgi:cell wall-associated NlpC family hydrolase